MSVVKNICENETLDLIPLNAIPLNVYKKVCNPCIVYMVLFLVFLIFAGFYLLSLVFKKR